jgi:hypothetical protein
LQPELRKDCVLEEVARTIKIALLCVQHLPQMRPTMSEVVTMFLGKTDVEVVFDKFDKLYYKFDRGFESVNRHTEYPTLEAVEEDSNVVPLLHLDSQSSFYNMDSSSSSHFTETELTQSR